MTFYIVLAFLAGIVLDEFFVARLLSKIKDELANTELGLRAAFYSEVTKLQADAKAAKTAALAGLNKL
jgi:hypothetical protein